MRFAFWSTGRESEGAGRWLAAAARSLHAGGHDVRVAAADGCRLDAAARLHGIPVAGVPSGGRWRRWLRARAFVRSYRPYAVVLAATDQDILRPSLGRPRSLCLVLADDLLAMAGSPARDDDVVWLRSEDAGSVDGAVPPPLVVPYGVRLAPVPDRTAARRELRLPRWVPLLLQVGPLEPDQEHATTLRALAQVFSGDTPTPHPVVAFVGTGPEEESLRLLCHELGLQRQVLWVGHRKDVDAYLDAADVLLGPGAIPDWLVLEAWSRRLPVLVADGATRLVHHDETGLVFAARDAAALARALRRCLGDRSLAPRLAEAAFRSLSPGWTEAALCADLESLVFASALRCRSAGPGGRIGFFVDRDDTLVYDVPYNGDPSAVRLEPLAGRALRWVQAAGWPVLVVSNQSGVARGLHDEDQVHAVNARLAALLDREGAGIDAFYFCPHHPDFGGACDCRKPEPGMLLRAAREHGIDLGRSVMVGDSERDLEAGRRAGTHVVGYAPRGGGKLDAASPVAADWLQLVRDVLGRAWGAP